jgi:hypothetical protein
MYKTDDANEKASRLHGTTFKITLTVCYLWYDLSYAAAELALLTLVVITCIQVLGDCRKK